MKSFGRNVRLATELGLSMGLMAALWTLVGLWLGLRADAWLGTRPIGTILLLLAGAAAGQFSLFRLAAHARPALETDSRHAFGPRDGLRAARLAVMVLLLLAVPILLGLVLGIWLDSLAGTHVLFTLLLALGCMGAGMYAALRIARARPSSVRTSR